MKKNILTLFIAGLLTIPAFASRISGTRLGAGKQSAGFFVEAYSATGRVWFSSVKFDEKGQFSLELPDQEALVYWIDNFPVYVMLNQDLKIVLPARQSSVAVLGLTSSAPTASIVANGPAAKLKPEENTIKIIGKSSANALLIYQLNTLWADFLKNTSQPGPQELDQHYAKVLKLIGKSKDQKLKELASFYNDNRCLEAKVQYLRTHPSVKPGADYFEFLDHISLNSPAINTLKPIGIRSLVTNYYLLSALAAGKSFDDEELLDNASLVKIQFLLNKTSHERVLNEDLVQRINYYLSIKGWNPELDVMINQTLEKLKNQESKQQLMAAKEKYSKVSKNAMAPDFSIPDANGKLVKLSDFKGKILAIDVWATWCVPCMHTLPSFLKLREKYKDHKEIAFVTISTDSKRPAWLAFLKEKQMNGIDLHAGDPAASAFEKAYNITGIPRYILIDRTGRILEDHAIGAYDPAYEQLILEAIQAK